MFANKDQKPLKPSIQTASLSLCRSLSDSIRISLLQKHSRKATAVLQAQPGGAAPVPGQREEAGLRHSVCRGVPLRCMGFSACSPLPRCAAELRPLCLTAHSAGYGYKSCHKQTYSACKQLELPCLQQNCGSRERSQKRG